MEVTNNSPTKKGKRKYLYLDKFEEYRNMTDQAMETLRTKLIIALGVTTLSVLISAYVIIFK